jgi:hypothetical protein
MTQRNEDVDTILEELERYGLRGEVGHRGGGHLEIAWNAPQGRRFIIVAKTPSDWRARLNNRSDLRKMLRADGLQPKAISELSFQKAMSLPRQPTISKELALQNDVDALTDIVLEMQDSIIELKNQNQLLHDKLSSITVVSAIRFAGHDKPEDADLTLQVSRKLYEDVKDHFGPFRANSTQSKILSYTSLQYKTVHEIVEQSGVAIKYVATTLSEAKKLGYLESGLRGSWRRKQ